MGITEFLNESYKIYGKPAPVVFENVKKAEWHLSLTTFVFNAKTAFTAWSPNARYNEVFICAQWHYINDLLAVRGYVFLNDALDALGLKQTKWRSFRISNHWNWRQNFDVDKCSLPNYIQCFCADMPVSKANSHQKGKKTEPIFAISVAYFGDDQKYHVLFGEKYNRKEHKWEWVESSIDDVVRSVLRENEYGEELEFHD